MADRVLAQKIVDVLERIREIDEPTLRRILHAQVEVAPAIAADELLGVFCWAPGEEGPGRPALDTTSTTLHGILNAACGIDRERGVIVARVSDAGVVESVRVAEEPTED